MLRRCLYGCAGVATILLSGFPGALAQMKPFQVGPDGQLTLSPEARQAAIDDMLGLVLKNRNRGKEEKVDFVKVIPLLPRVDSQVKNIDVVGYVLSDGTEGHIVSGPLIPPGPPKPSGLAVEADLETGTYTARELSPDELKVTIPEEKRHEIIIQETFPSEPDP